MQKIPESWSQPAREMASYYIGRFPEYNCIVIAKLYFRDNGQCIRIEVGTFELESLEVADVLEYESQEWKFGCWQVTLRGEAYTFARGPTHEIAFLNAFDEFMFEKACVL